MKKNNTPKFDIFELLQSQGLSKLELQQIATDTGFIKRQSRKISGSDFFSLMLLESQKGSPSYNDLVARFDSMCKISASKQAIGKRVNSNCVLFFQAVLARIISLKIANKNVEAMKACGKYDRVIVQDSTIIKLPLQLFKQFSGVSNDHTAVCNARVQGVYDLLSGRFLYFSIDPYSKNDLSAAPELELLKNDLVLRDRGYFTSGEIERHRKAGADCIYRHKCKTIYLDPVSGQPINLAALLKKNSDLDIDVCLNNPEHTKVRLLAAPVSQQIANIRRMKAKKETHGRNPSPEVLELMGWSIFITTIQRSDADFDKISKTYSLRWIVEIIFKTWKSHMKFDEIHNVSFNQLQILLTARLSMIVLIIHGLFIPLCKRISAEFNRDLSMLKFMNFIKRNQEEINELVITFAKDNGKSSNVDLKLIKYCAYDKRKRLNLRQLERMIFLS
jgi:hypothetical protein